MNIEGLCKSIRKRINAFRKTELFEKSKPLQYDILAIEIAINLAELKVNHNRNVEESEKYWFKGGYYISNDLTGEWKDISEMYDQLVKNISLP